MRLLNPDVQDHTQSSGMPAMSRSAVTVFRRSEPLLRHCVLVNTLYANLLYASQTHRCVVKAWKHIIGDCGAPGGREFGHRGGHCGRCDFGHRGGHCGRDSNSGHGSHGHFAWCSRRRCRNCGRAGCLFCSGGGGYGGRNGNGLGDCSTSSTPCKPPSFMV